MFIVPCFILSNFSSTKLVNQRQLTYQQNAEQQRITNRFVCFFQARSVCFLSYGKKQPNEQLSSYFSLLFSAFWKQQKSPDSVENQDFYFIFQFIWRCVRDSNPWPHAWQACILTNWTNAPEFHFFIAVSLDCGCKGSCFFYICNSWERFFSSFSFICWL